MKKYLPLSVLIIVLCAAFTNTESMMRATSLTITVLDDLGTVQKGAKVQLFETEEDYSELKNAIGPLLTDEKGKVKFKGLKAIDYYIFVEKGEKSNLFGGERIGKLAKGKFNKTNIIISK